MTTAPHIHLCSADGCDSWGSFGRKLRRPDGTFATVWRCRVHLWGDFFAAAPAPVAPPAAPVAKPPQGRLFG